MDVLDEQDHRPFLRESLEQPARRPERLSLAQLHVGQAEDLRDPFDDPILVVGVAEEPGELSSNLRGRVDVFDVGRLLHRLGDRPVGDPVAVRQAPTL